MEEMMCYKCRNFCGKVLPEKVSDIEKTCSIKNVLQVLELDENRIYCPSFDLLSGHSY